MFPTGSRRRMPNGCFAAVWHFSFVLTGVAPPSLGVPFRCGCNVFLERLEGRKVAVAMSLIISAFPICRLLASKRWHIAR